MYFRAFIGFLFDNSGSYMAAGFVFTLHIAVIVHFLISLFQKFGTSEIYAICYILGSSGSGNAWTRDTSVTSLKYLG